MKNLSRRDTPPSVPTIRPECVVSAKVDDTIFRGISNLAQSVHEIEGRLSVTLERLTGRSYSGLGESSPQTAGILGVARTAMDAAQSSVSRIHQMLADLESELPSN